MLKVSAQFFVIHHKFMLFQLFYLNPTNPLFVGLILKDLILYKNKRKAPVGFPFLLLLFNY